MLRARARANSYEKIGAGIFRNRSGMKMAEIDASFNFMFTSHKDFQAYKAQDLLYFSDICAVPGGFSEYVLWRTKWYAKGFGFTVRAEEADDFKLEKFISGTRKHLTVIMVWVDVGEMGIFLLVRISRNFRNTY